MLLIQKGNLGKQTLFSLAITYIGVNCCGFTYFITLHMNVDIIPMRLGVFIREISVKISLTKGFWKVALDRMFDIWPKNPSMLSY